jgi:hypothetical protein
MRTVLQPVNYYLHYNSFYMYYNWLLLPPFKNNGLVYRKLISGDNFHNDLIINCYLPKTIWNKVKLSHPHLHNSDSGAFSDYIRFTRNTIILKTAEETVQGFYIGIGIQNFQ